MTHGYSILELSRPAFDEIRRKLKEAGYEHAFEGEDTIDMHGIAVQDSDDGLCKTCKHWEKDGTCIMLAVVIEKPVKLKTPANFGCVQWEAK